MNPNFPILRSAVGYLLLVATLAGCAQRNETQLSWSRADAPAELNRHAFLACVDSQVTAGSTYLTFTDTDGELLAGSADPREARGRVWVQERDGGLQISLWQRDAWQDRGGLINAAYLCAHG